MKLQKRESAQRGLSNRTSKNPIVQYAGVISYMILLLMRIPLAKVIGDAGIGLFAPAFEIFFLITLVTSYSMTNTVSAMIRYRVKRERYRNARQVFRSAFFVNMLVSMVLAVLVAAGSSFIADILVLEPLSRMAIIAVAPVLVLAAFIGVLRGYFSGYGLGALTVQSQYLEGITMIVCGLFSAGAFHTYGMKVAALRQNITYSYAYGALGAMVGVLLSQVITAVYLLVICVVYSGTMRSRVRMDTGKRMESKLSVQHSLIVSCVPLAVIAVLSNLFMIIDQRMFNYCMNKSEMGETRTALWGSYYGKWAVLIGVGAAIGVLSVYAMPGRIGLAYDKKEYRLMKDRIGKAVRRLCIILFPIAVFLAALAQAIVTSLYAGKSDMLAAWVRKGAVLIVLYGFCFLFGQLLYRMHMINELFVSTTVSMLVHVITAYLLVQKAYMGADGIVYALIVFFALYAALNFFFISRNLRYQQEWFGGVIFPAAAAAVSGVAVMLVERFMLEPVGGLLTIVTGVVVGLFLYITFLMVLRVIGELELSRMPLGFFFIMLGKNLGIL